jgi:predicted amidophosphoribosyltransferase
VARLAAGGAYEGFVRALVLDLKLRGRRPAATALGRLIAAAARRLPLRARALAWVPGRREDLARRGFDHAALLAVETARLLGVPARPLLVRVADTVDQTTLSRAARQANLEGAFCARPCRGAVAVVDDLITTGATAAAAAAALRRAGANEVELLTACAAPPPSKSDY